MNPQGYDVIARVPTRAMVDGTSAVSTFGAPVSRPLGHLHSVEALRPSPQLVTDDLAPVDPLWARVQPYLMPGLFERCVKPAFDRVLAFVLLLIALPIIVIAALALRSQVGKGGALIPQQRVGRGGHPFTMYKLRTMRPDRRHRHVPFDGPDRRVRHKTVHDPRHTPRGMLVRKLSIDELPQLWNVVKGDMSLVGPRPELCERVDGGLRSHPRHQVKPGLTGPWQISADRNRPIRESLDRDLAYVLHITLWGDLMILARTAAVVFRGHGS